MTKIPIVSHLPAHHPVILPSEKDALIRDLKKQLADANKEIARYKRLISKASQVLSESEGGDR